MGFLVSLVAQLSLAVSVLSLQEKAHELIN